ncbi:MAG: MerR family transcriptional regulator [Polyangiales bacterium]
MSTQTLLPDKHFFKIGEVADIVGVKAHALRYWETEFAALRPKKTRGSHRQYSRKDVELAMLIRQLLHDEGYTIPGARKKIRELGHHHRDSPPEPRAQREVGLRAELIGLRNQLQVFLDELSARSTPNSFAFATRTSAAPITHAVPASARAVPVRAER